MAVGLTPIVDVDPPPVAAGDTLLTDTSNKGPDQADELAGRAAVLANGAEPAGLSPGGSQVTPGPGSALT
jgi:hypothetical protein